MPLFRFTLLVAVLTGAGCAAARPRATPVAPMPTGAPTLALAASGQKFSTAELRAPAGKAFGVRLRNDDRDVHNFELRDATGKRVFVGELFSGPSERVEVLPALDAGRYAFLCTAHPYMQGQLLAE
ncbi:MAG: cupredoxin domain-containing protein [Chloroflexota bacterium]|nr:cupredoxin domain-containing protein [Chloroflexota bacterium]